MLIVRFELIGVGLRFGWFIGLCFWEIYFSFIMFFYLGELMGVWECLGNFDELLEDNLYWLSSCCRRSNNVFIYYI